MPLDHVGVNVPDLAFAREYYDALMPLVGFRPFGSGADWFAYRPARGKSTQLYFYAAPEDGAYSRHRPGLQHLSFRVGGHADVRAAYEWARDRGDEVLNEPQSFPQYHPDCYAVFWTDPHGFKLEVCCFAVSAGPA